MSPDHAAQPLPPPTPGDDARPVPWCPWWAPGWLYIYMWSRRTLGEAKYGTGLTTNNGRSPIVEALQEEGDGWRYVASARMTERRWRVRVVLAVVAVLGACKLWLLAGLAAEEEG